jgi:hypothetical protein
MLERKRSLFFNVQQNRVVWCVVSLKIYSVRPMRLLDSMV